MPPISFEPRPRIDTGISLGRPRREELLLGPAAGVHQPPELQGREAVAELLHGGVGQRQVHVVAAQQDVVADRDALERQVALAVVDHGDEGEVGGAAADVADEHDVAGLQAARASRRRPGDSQA